MILSEFSKYLQANENEIVKNKSCTKLLGDWACEILGRKPQNNVEKIIHTEISLATNKAGHYLLIAKSESGRTLTEALYNFAQSYEHHVMKKWLDDKKASDFSENAK